MEKKLFIVLGLAAILACPVMAMPTLTMANDGTPAYQLTINQPLGDVKAGTYTSMCIESQEYFNPNGTYYYDVSGSAINGGYDWNSGFGSTFEAEGFPNLATPDPLDLRTSWLFTQFVTGALGTGQDAAVQRAIHYIEAENDRNLTYNYASWSSNIAPQWQKYVAQADYAVSTNAWTNHGGVRLLNLWVDDGKKQIAQDQIIYVPAPGAILLASMGMGLVGWLRRRQAL